MAKEIIDMVNLQVKKCQNKELKHREKKEWKIKRKRVRLSKRRWNIYVIRVLERAERERGRERENKTASIFEDILAENFLKMKILSYKFKKTYLQDQKQNLYLSALHSKTRK